MMSDSQNTIKYVKHNKIRIKTDKKRDEVNSVLLKFFEKIERKPMGMKGFIVMDDLQDSQESIVITFWERKEDMELFYKPNSNVLGDLVEKLNLQMATFAAGCFWGVEEAFRKVKGVNSTTVGYTGGRFENPTYKDVCTHTTGHAEALLIQFDPNEVSYEQLLDIFWSIHDPTTKNRQGPDIGSQYRSMIAYHTQEQELVAKKSKADLEISGRFGGGTIVTEIVPASTFYQAEDYHQKYYQKRGGGSCYYNPVQEVKN